MGFIEVEKTIKKQSYNMTEAQFHDFFEIYFLTEGSRQVFIENKLYKLTAPAVCFIPPFVMHKTEGESYERINVYISKEHISQEDSALLSFLAKTPAYQLNNSQKNFVTQILEEAIKLEKNAPFNIKNIKSSFIKTVIYYLSLQNLTPIVEAGFTKRNNRTDESIQKSYLILTKITKNI